MPIVSDPEGFTVSVSAFVAVPDALSVTITVIELEPAVVVTAQDGVSMKTYTIAAVRSQPPVATTSAPTAVLATTATLNGAVDGGGLTHHRLVVPADVARHRN